MRVLCYGLSADKLAGTETYIFNFANYLSPGIRFDYVIEAEESIHDKRIANLGAEVYHLPPKRSMASNTLAWIKLLNKEKQNYDAVYFNLYSLSWLVPIILCRMNHMSVIVHAHNNALHTGGILLLLHKVGKRILNKMNVLRLTNSSLSSEFFYYPTNKVETVLNAIDTERFCFNAKTRDLIRSECGLKGKNVYSFFGRLAKQKNPMMLMDVFFEISKLDHDAAFLVVGDGDIASDVKAKAKDLGIPVLFTGLCLNTEDYYCASDLMILPSEYEGLGIVLIEAQCNGLPCVYSADVIPALACVSDLCCTVSLSSGPSVWAKRCVEMMVRNKATNRSAYAAVVSESGFSLDTESKRLAAIFHSYVKC